MSERLTTEQVVRLLRAKAHELESIVLNAQDAYGSLRPVDEVRADIALVASLLADHIEASD